MSFFHDDFYSTKMSKWGQRGWNRQPQNNGGIVWIAVISAVLGALLCFGLVMLVRPSASSGHDQVVVAADKVKPAVVSVLSTMKDAKQDKTMGTGLGSGIIFQKTGGKARIATNFHVIDGGTSFEIVLPDGKHKKATVLGKDMYTDLAVLETDSEDITSIAEFGNSDLLKAGQTAIAIGNPLGLDFSQTVTTGVISRPKSNIPVSLGQNGELDWEIDVIQTDAAINQGNSGGPLVGLDGKVIGINSLKIASTGVEGLGFAIPINQAKPILDALIQDSKIKRPAMGITLEDLQSYQSGLEVLKLPENVKTGVIVLDATGPAKEAGLKTSDVIVELDGKPVNSALALRKYLYNEKKIGDKLSITYYRAGKKASATLTLAEL
ncbi:S1C family serine protease [Paenibacillus sp. MBLB4367]|uniref:S1C family serine protease n=1 Tax=Paenibacillus sp. MBLB4367 TaxID=3384767 RepID=UPI0039083887